MIIALDRLKEIKPDLGFDDTQLKFRLEAIEAMIRAYTNNNFQVRTARIKARSEGGAIIGTSPFIVAGDTVQVSQTDVNDGVYVVKEVSFGRTSLDKRLFDLPMNTVTLIRYPADIVNGCINLLEYQANQMKLADDYKDRVGVASETVARHTVEYDSKAFDYSNLASYPDSLKTFLKPYKRMRY